MPLLDNISQCKSLSIIGMAKNTGKTVCLNHLLSGLRQQKKRVAVTSVGIDGEKTDLVTQTEKPEIELGSDFFFQTSEYHYRQRTLTSELTDVSEAKTSLGRLVTARVLIPGKVILSGPATTEGVRKYLALMESYNTDIAIVDGALSRKSHASPVLTDGLILATGAAIAPDLKTIINKTSFLRDLMQLPEYDCPFIDNLIKEESGIFALRDNNFISLEIPSSLLTDKYRDKIFAHGSTLFVSGILTDMMLNFLKLQPEIKNTTIIVKDFTKIFVTPMTLRLYLSKGGKLFVAKKPNLLAVTINPFAPSGFSINSDILKAAMQEIFSVPVYDVKKEEI